MTSAKFSDFYTPSPLVTIPFTQPISTIVTFWPTPLPPPQCGRHLSIAPNKVSRAMQKHLISADGVWVWGGWTTCSTTCGAGTRTRTATSCQGPFYAGIDCVGSGVKTEACQSKLIWQIFFTFLWGCSFQLREPGQLGVHGVHARQLAILAWELEQEASLVVSHVLAAHLILEIVTVSRPMHVCFFENFNPTPLYFSWRSMDKLG